MRLLLYACFFFATSLSSPSLGRFFSVPGWLGGKSVASSRTYGSPDATNATHRIDNDALKAVNALFEGFSERCYYAHEGPSNVWTEADYGPTASGTDKTGFRFSLPSNVSELATFAWEPDTNRVANAGTRRFVEYDHIDRLAHAMAESGYTINLEDLTKVVRPNWREGEYDTYYNDRGILWSSTIFDKYTSKPLPTFAWSSFAACGVKTNEWQASALTWNNCEEPRDGEFGWRSNYAYSSDPQVLAYDMMSDIYWGEPDLTPLEEHVPNAFALTNTTEDVISLPFGGWTTWTEKRVREVRLTKDDILEGSVPTPDGVYHDGAWLLNEVHNIVRGEYDKQSDVPETIHVTAQVGAPSGFARDFGEAGYSLAYLYAGTINVASNMYPWSKYVNMYMIDDFPGRVEISAHETSDVPVDISFDVSGPDIWYSNLTPVQNFSSSTPLPAHVITLEYDEPHSNPVCKVHGLATNDTRRLYPDRVAGLGQCLGALDRTYAPMNATVPTATNVAFRGAIVYESEPLELGITKWDGGRAICGSVQPFSEFSSTTNELYATNWLGHSDTDGVAMDFCSHSEDSMGLLFSSVSSTETLSPASQVIASTNQWFGPYETNNWYHFIHFYAKSPPAVFDVGETALFGGGGFELYGEHEFYIYAYLSTTNGESFTLETTPSPLPNGNISFKADTVYSRNYWRRYSSGDIRFDATKDSNILYPGSFDRVMTAKLWTLTSLISEAGASNRVISPNIGYYFPSNSPTVYYRATTSDYSSHSVLTDSMTTQFSDALSKCRTETAGLIGVSDCDDPFKVIPMADSDANFNARVTFGTKEERESGEVVIVTLDTVYNAQLKAIRRDGEESYTLIKTDGTEVRMASDSVPLVGVTLRPAQLQWTGGVDMKPTCRPVYGASSNARLRGLSRVDWSWGALKRD